MGFLVSSFPNLFALPASTCDLGNLPRFPSKPPAPADPCERRQPCLREASSRPRHSSLSISRRLACAVNNKVLRRPRRTRRPLCVFYSRVLGKSGLWGCDREPRLRLALEPESRLHLGREERQGARVGRRGGAGGGAALARITAEAGALRAARRGCSHCTAEHPTFNRRSPREPSPSPPRRSRRSPCAPRPRAPWPRKAWRRRRRRSK